MSIRTETLRKHQLLDVSRVCVKDYQIPGSNVTIKKGTNIAISPYTLHHDEKFYSEAEKFDPTRFSSKTKATQSTLDVPYMPFGDGPRSCIGMKMGKITSKIGVCTILQQYRIALDDRHIGKDGIGKELKFSVSFRPIDGIHLKLKAK